MVSIIIEGRHSVGPWEPSPLKGDIVCGDQMEWILAIIDGGGSVRALIAGFTRKQR